MITYRRCTETNEDAIFEAFQTGFSDYMVKFELTKDAFFNHFFGPEGNSLEYSVIALDGEIPVGLMLGGIKVYEGLKTLRCGGMCVHPEYRGTEVSHRLFDLHREIALVHDCKQLFLEVIVGNDRAIHFYKKKGYEKKYDLYYYSHDAPSDIQAALPEDVTVKRINLDILRSLRDQTKDIHINWQNDFDYISRMKDQVHYGVYHGEQLIGGLSIHPSGKISWLWIDAEHRHRGIGRGPISRAVEELNPKKLSIHFPNHTSLMGFVKRLNFIRNAISQYEMYLTL